MDSSNGVGALHDESLDLKPRAPRAKKDKSEVGGNEVKRPDYQAFTAIVTIQGTAPILFHRYDPENVEAQSKAKKGSKEKRTDNIDAYVYRCEDGTLAIPAICFKSALADAGRRFQDPASPRKSARDLVRAGILVSPHMASLGVKAWDAVDVRGVVVQKARVTRRRPMLNEGWQVTFEVEVHEPDLISEDLLYQLVERAGKFNGLMDFRPDFGRFRIVKWDVRKTV